MAEKATERSHADLRKYKRIPRAKGADDAKSDEPGHVILVGHQHPPKSYIASAIDMLEGGQRSVVLKGLGGACGRVVAIAEIIKRRVPGVYQITKVESEETAEKYELKEEHKESDLEAVIEVKRSTPGLHICLSLDAMDKADPGYQDPLPDEEVTEEDKARRETAGKGAGKGGGGGGGGRGGEPGRGRGKGGRGGRGGGSAGDEPRSKGKGKGKGGRGFGGRRGEEQWKGKGKGGGYF